MFTVLGHPVFCEVSLFTPGGIVGELDENDLNPTPLDYLLPLLEELKLTPLTYQACVRRFRHWFKVHVVEELVRQSTIIFEMVKLCAETFRESNAPLFPLNVQLSTEQAQTQMHWILQRRQILEEQLASNPSDNPEEKHRYRQALCGMESMLWLLSGSWIQNLIPDGCPTGYVCSRLDQLLKGLALGRFDGYQTKMTTDGDNGHHLPSDSTIFLFLMCLYLKAPGWNLQLFHSEPPKVRNGPMVLMNVDPLMDPAYSAFLTNVPAQRQSHSNGCILRHRSRTVRTEESVITLLLNGKLRANFGGIDGFFEGMTVFLAYHRLKFGNIGGVKFEIMPGLDWVFEEQIVP